MVGGRRLAGRHVRDGVGGRQRPKQVERRREEQGSGDGGGHVENAVVVSRRHADEHAVEHQFDDRRVRRIGDIVRAVLAGRRVAEGHVVAEDVALDAVGVGDRVEADVRVAGPDVVAEFDVVELGAPDHAFLFLDGQRLPPGEVVQVFLHDDVTAAREIRVVVGGDQGGLGGGAAGRVLGAVDEPEQVPRVEVAEPDRVVLDAHVRAERVDEAARELEHEIAAVGADVEQHVAGGGGRVVAPATRRRERVQVRGTRRAGRPETVPVA